MMMINHCKIDRDNRLEFRDESNVNALRIRILSARSTLLLIRIEKSDYKGIEKKNDNGFLCNAYIIHIYFSKIERLITWKL